MLSLRASDVCFGIKGGFSLSSSLFLWCDLSFLCCCCCIVYRMDVPRQRDEEDQRAAKMAASSG